MTDSNLQTNNPNWGFHGSIAEHADAACAWPFAMASIADAASCADDEVLVFLDSRHGRHFADDVANGLGAGLGLDGTIQTATARWMAWRTIAPPPARPASHAGRPT